MLIFLSCNDMLYTLTRLKIKNLKEVNKMELILMFIILPVVISVITGLKEVITNK